MIQTARMQIDDDLCEFLHRMHDAHEVCDKQSMRNGTAGHLPMDTRAKAILKLRRSLTTAIAGLLGHSRWGYTGLWSTRLPKGGYHVKHNHPKGWMSGVCYIDVPSSAGGLLEFESSFLIPRTGDVVVFPSDTVHGVTEYQGDKPRLTVAFDLLYFERGVDERNRALELKRAA